MTALVQAISRISATTNTETETLKMLSIFCGLGLLASLIAMACGVDFGVGLS